MKTTLALAALLFGSVAFSDLHAQGQFQWGNAGVGGVISPIYAPNPANPLEIRTGNTATGTPAGTQTYAGALLGSAYTAAIYVGRTAADVMATENTPPLVNGTAPFRNSAAGAGTGRLATGGFTANADNGLQIGTIPGGTVGVNYELRAWDNRGGTVTSWTMVMAAGGQIAAGTSGILVFGAALAVPPNTPPLTDGIRSFQLTQVPEPSLIALGALGLGALLLRRRK
jgi:hypothetical protein